MNPPQKQWLYTRFFCLVLLAAFIAAPAFGLPKNQFDYRMIYDQMGIHKGGWKKLIDHIKMGAASGYNCIVTCEWAFENIEDQKPEFFTQFNQVMAEGVKHKVKVIPWHFYQQHGAHENWNLAETFPVRGTKFVVKNKEAWGEGDHDVGLKNGDFEYCTGNVPTGWSQSYLPGANIVVDKITKKTGTACLRVRNAPKFSRITQQIKLKPFRAYQVSAWFKTSKIASYGEVQFSAEGNNGGLLSRRERPFGTPIIDPEGNRGGHWTTLSPTQGWRKSVIDFNSLTSTTAKFSLWFSYRSVQGGDIWVDDIQIREVGLYEVVRGGTREIIVKSADGSKTYAEGSDYVVDPKCNDFGLENYDYEGHLKIPAGSAIQEGQELRVDWYQYANVETIVPESDFCLKKTWETLADNVDQMDKLFGNSDAMYCNIDEWRVAGWNPNCASFKFKTAGEYMAKSWSGIESLLRSKGNGCRSVFVWNDMLDPYHNAWNGPYGMVFGNTCYGSYKGLSHDAIINNWNACGQKWREKSIRFFGGVDTAYPGVKCRQILNALDAGVMSNWLNILDAAEKEGVEGVVGISWTTWAADYSHLAPVANVCKARGRWPNTPFPVETCAPKPVAIKKDVAAANTGTGITFNASAGTGRTANIQYSVTEFGRVNLTVYDLHGRCVQTLINGKKEIGSHQFTWKTSSLSSGVYFLRLSVDGVGQKAIKQTIF